MNILVDENIPRRSVSSLIALGHDVRDLRGTPDEGADDQRVWALAQESARLLITTDKGFALRRTQHHSGILIILLRQPSCERIHARIITAITSVMPDDWRDLLVVMRDTAVSRWRLNKRDSET